MFRIHYDQTFEVVADTEEDALQVLAEAGVWRFDRETGDRITKTWDDTRLELVDEDGSTSPVFVAVVFPLLAAVAYFVAQAAGTYAGVVA